MNSRLNFFNRAKLHQEAFRVNYLKLNDYDVYPTILSDEDALKGYNFYMDCPGMLDVVKGRHKKPGGPLYKNMLRSEHIPFNFFGPLCNDLDNPLVSYFFNVLFPDLSIALIDKIEFEKSPETKSSVYLNDKTYLM